MENNEKKTAQLIIESLKLKDKELSRNGYDLQSPFRQGFMLAETIVKKTVNKNKADEDLSDNEKKLFSLLGLNEPSPDKGETATREGEGNPESLGDYMHDQINGGEDRKFEGYTPPKGIEAGKSLEECKDDIAGSDGHESWDDLLEANRMSPKYISLCSDEANKRFYASQRPGCPSSNIISFGNHLRCEITADGNKIEVINAVNGWGDNIPLSEIDILSKELPQPPSNKL